jgi:hypothetical protein
MIKPKTALALVMLVLALKTRALANTFTVTNTNDTGTGSLRQAITNANNNSGLDTIDFNIPGAGVHTITPVTPLPNVTDAVIIDGYTQPGASANTLAVGDNAQLLIQLDGSTTAGNGLAFGPPGGSTVRGLIINNYQVGISLSLGFQNGSSNNLIEGNFIGVDASGTMAVATSTAVGTESSTSNTIGGTTPAARNVLCGTSNAVDLKFSNSNIVQGNYIGVSAAGTAGLATGTGILIQQNSSSNIIGGTVTGSGNIIGAFSLAGINLSSAANNIIQGNLIGTNAAGTSGLGSGTHGVTIGSSTGTQIGGTVAGAGNLISGASGDGITVNLSSGTVIQGNLIGTDVTGSVAIPNGNAGVDIINVGGAGNGSMIGGTAFGAGNIIAFNGTHGVVIASGNTQWPILGNSIFSNAGLGITLGGRPDDLSAVPTPNDAGDGDTGANNLQNYPVIESVSSSGGMTTISGKLNSAANTTYRIEFFANDATDPTGFAEGDTFIGSTNATTNTSGDASFNVSFAQIGADQRVTATATDPNNNTSEFSAAAAMGQLLNISTRMKVLTGNSVLIGGFIIGGSGSKEVLLRALGPTLAQFGVTGALADPTMELHNGAGTLLASNDNWKDTQQAAISATGLAPPNDLESAILSNLASGNYTAIVRGKNNTTGAALVEAYDVDQAIDTTLTNISTRGFVNTGQNVMIGGFISGNGLVKIIVRALGPTLSQFGVPNVLADPTLELHDANGAILASNDNWQDTQQAEIQASGFAPPNALESAIIATRPPGNSTAIVRGKNNTTGNALVEVYILSP